MKSIRATTRLLRQRGNRLAFTAHVPFACSSSSSINSSSNSNGRLFTTGSNKPSTPTPTPASTTTTTTSANPTTNPALAPAAAAEGDGTTSTTTTTGAAEDLLKAPFTKVNAGAALNNKNKNNKGLFPWRSSPEILDRLIPGTSDYETKGLLLGGNLTSSNPRLDGLATSYFFLRIPFLDLLLFRSATEQDLADSMAYAFQQAVENITTTTTTTATANDDGIGPNTNATETENKDESSQQLQLHDMMEPTKLAKLFESAREFGKDSLQVKLDVKPITYDNTSDSTTNDEDDDDDGLNHLGLDGPKIVSLFVFPFLSRNMIADNKEPQHVRKYHRMLDAMSSAEGIDSSESLQLSRDMMDNFRNRGVSENTVVCQVLIPCKETFWVKDNSSSSESESGGGDGGGDIIQGDTKRRTVVHLVRFEQVTKTHIVNDAQGFFPFRHELGEWKITDIDDLCQGNLLL